MTNETRLLSLLFMGIGAGILLSNSMREWEFPQWIQGIAIIALFGIGIALYYSAEMRGEKW